MNLHYQEQVLFDKDRVAPTESLFIPWPVDAHTEASELLISFHPFLDCLEPLEESSKEKAFLHTEEHDQW